MMHIIFYLVSVFAALIHARSNQLFYSIVHSFSRFEFTFKTAIPALQRSLVRIRKSLKSSLLFWGCTVLAVLAVGAISIRNPLMGKFENEVQGIYLASYSTDLKTLFGQAPEYIAVTPDARSQILFGIDADTPICTSTGQPVSLEDLQVRQPLTVRWNGEATSPQGIVIEVMDWEDPFPF